MPDFQWLLDKAKNLNFNEFIKHLRNYLSLYTNPHGAWKKVISNRKEGFDFIILHIIYFMFVLFIILEIKDFRLYRLVFLEVLLTGIPVLLVIIPFLFFNKFFNKKYSWIKLFRLFLIVKLQILPLIIVLILALKFLNIDDLYVIFDNVISLVLILYIIIFPIIIRLSIWRKICWIIGNYFVVMIEILMIVSFCSKIDYLGKSFDKLSINTPSNEFIKYSSDNLIDVTLYFDKYYFVHYIKINSNKFFAAPQFVSNELLDSFFDSRLYELHLFEDKSNSILMIKNMNEAIPKYNSIPFELNSHSHLTIGELDTMRTSINKTLNSLYKQSKVKEDSCVFESNRDYFRALKNYVNDCMNRCTDSTKINYILNSSEIIGRIDFDQNNFGVMYRLNPNYEVNSKKKFKELETKLNQRVDNSYFILSILTYPIELLFGVILDDK